MSLHLFWTLEEYERHLRHPEIPVRLWALQGMRARSPRRSAQAAATLLNAEDNTPRLWNEILSTLLDFPDVAAPHQDRLLALLPDLSGFMKAILYELLGKVAPQRIRPELLRLLDSVPDDEELPSSLRLEIAGALRTLARDNKALRDPDVRQAMWRYLERLLRHEELAYIVAQALLAFPSPEDIRRLLDLMVSRRTRFPDTRNTALLWEAWIRERKKSVLLAWLSCLDWILQGTSLLDHVDRIFNVEEPVFTAVLEQRLKATYFSPRAYLRGLLRGAEEEIRFMAAKRGDDLDGWLAAWEAGEEVRGYPFQAAYTLYLLGELRRKLSPDQVEAVSMAAAGLFLAAEYMLEVNEDALLGRAADDEARLRASVDLLLSPQFRTPEGLLDELTGRGEELLEHLEDRLDQFHFLPTFAQERLLRLFIDMVPQHGQAIARLWRRYFLDTTSLEDLTGIFFDLLSSLLALLSPHLGDEIVRWARREFDLLSRARDELDEAEEDAHLTDYQSWLVGILSFIPAEPALDAALDFARELAEPAYIDILAPSLERLAHPRTLPTLRRLYDLVQETDQDAQERDTMIDELSHAIFVVATLHDIRLADADEIRERAYRLHEQTAGGRFMRLREQDAEEKR